MTEKELKDFISNMTLEEKVGQVNQPFNGTDIYKKVDGSFEMTNVLPDFCKKFEGIGSIYGVFRNDGWNYWIEEDLYKKSEETKIVKLINDYLKNNTRLKIPTLISEEVTHGVCAYRATVFPPNITIGSSFDVKSFEKMGEVVRDECMERDINVAFLSGLDIAVDKRWGRTEECFGEDPYLAYRMNKAIIKTIQKNNNVSVTIKHFIAQGATEDGKNLRPACIGIRELEQIHMPPMLGAIEADVDSVMIAYNEIDGIKCNSNKWLLRDYLRDTLGFKGFTMADGWAIDRMQWTTVNDSEYAPAMALNAGVNISLWDANYMNLVESIKKGYSTEEVLDDAVYHILSAKNKHGLFDEKPKEKIYSNVDPIEANVNIAASGAVLLKNDKNILPLKNKTYKIAVVGEDIDFIYHQLGDYTPRQTKEDLKKLWTYKKGFDQLAQDYKSTIKYFDFSVTDDKLSEFDIVFVLIKDTTARNFDVEYNEKREITKPSTRKMTSGEMWDGMDLKIDKKEFEFFKRTKNKNMITIANLAKPRVITKVLEKSNVVLNMWYPGSMGGLALLKILKGELEPSGRLNHTMPRYVGINNLKYNDKNAAGLKFYDSIESEVLLPFGFGLGYGNPSKITVLKSDTKAKTFKLKIENLNDTIRNEVILIYEKKHNYLTVQRVRELAWFDKIRLEPKQVIEINVHIDEIKNKEIITKEYEKGNTFAYSDFVISNGVDEIEVK